MREFYSHGKLLISGEYLVLQGALALAAPCKFGQKMIVDEKPGENNLHWISIDSNGNVWTDVLISKTDLTPFRGSLKNIDADVYNTLDKILHTSRKLNPAFLKTNTETIVTNYLEFDRTLGLGSSSTLINNIAQFANVDAFKLNKEVFGGSGYDIACAKSKQVLFYKVDDEGPVYDTINFNPPNQEKIFFVHLNKKQDSKIEVERFKSGDSKFTDETEIISEITEALLFCDDFKDFMQLLDEHENVIQFVLQEEKVKTKLFPDFNGVIKSLGAWGGDFVMAAAEMDTNEIQQYFIKKGFPVIFSYTDMIL
ncbi:MAG: GHMP kinase [Fimbriimonadaceae bacterium]|nr:GHMP kinase [Chitinophagales bacterium]